MSQFAQTHILQRGRALLYNKKASLSKAQLVQAEEA